MGKTETGAIWLSAERTSPYAFYQYWVNVDDADAGKCLRFLTELDQQEIEVLDKSREDDPGRRESQKKLAQEVTLMIHGQEGLDKAMRATQIFFGAEISELSDADLGEIFLNVPNSAGTFSALDGDGMSLIDALAETGLCKSKGEARRAIGENSVCVNNVRTAEIDYRLNRTDLASESMIVLRRGKKKYAVLKFE